MARTHYPMSLLFAIDKHHIAGILPNSAMVLVASLRLSTTVLPTRSVVHASGDRRCRRRRDG
jgi:hypothetical protein